MTNAQHRKSSMGAASMAAQDCKGSADYAAYAFAHDDEAQARQYVRHLEENLGRLKSELYSLDRANKRIAANGPEGTE